MSIMNLKEEIHAKILDNHVNVIIKVLDQLLSQSLDNSICSYSKYYSEYIRLNSMLNFCFNGGHVVNHNKIYDVSQKIELIKELRYKNVCKNCNACKTRKKPWPILNMMEHTDGE
jgi:hypothetical protein